MSPALALALFALVVGALAGAIVASIAWLGLILHWWDKAK